MAAVTGRPPEPLPAKALISRRGLTNRYVARSLPVNEHHLGRVLNGLERPSRRLREQLSEFLEVPERELFVDDDVATQAAALIERSRVARGLPATIEDPAILSRLAAAVRSGTGPT